MVVKTDICAYTEYKIYPGKGQRFVAKDGKTHLFINKKADSLFHQRIKPVKLTWTQAWRRKNKKGKIEDSNKRKKAKVQKFQKAIVGMSLDDLKRKKGQKTEFRQQAKEAAAKEAKLRQQKQAAAQKKATKTATAASAKHAPAKKPAAAVQKTKSSKQKK
jgi:large subunit ribosomal protein L24e